MTDHKPLSEGEVPYEMVDAAAYELRAEFKITLGREPPHLSIAQVIARAVLRKAFAATPKPLDGEAEMLATALNKHADWLHNTYDFGYMGVQIETLRKAAALLSLPAQTCEATDQFNAGRNDGLEAAVQLLIKYGNLINTGTWAAIRGLKRAAP